MPAAEDGEWSNWCSNVVCVRTKSSKDPDANTDIPVYVQPIVLKSVIRNDFSFPPSPPPPTPRTVHTRRRIARVIDSPHITARASPSLQYEGVGKISFNLKSHSSPTVHGYGLGGLSTPEISRVSYISSPRLSSHTRVALKKPINVDSSLDHHYYNHHYLPSGDFRSSFYPSVSEYRPATLPVVSAARHRRASSLPPVLSTAFLRRSSIPTIPTTYSSMTGTYSYPGGHLTDGPRSAQTKYRRGSVDVSYLSGSSPNLMKSTSHLRSSTLSSRRFSDAGLRTLRRGSLSAIGTGSSRERSIYRSGTGRQLEDEVSAVPSLSATPSSLSSLRSRTQNARDKLDTHRTLLDRYLKIGHEPTTDVRTDVENKFAQLANRMPELESYRSSASSASVSRRSSFSNALPPRSSATSRAPSTERAADYTTVHRQTTSPQTPNMSVARRRIRDLLFKVSGHEEYLN